MMLFLMNQRAEDLMMGAPSEVSPKPAPRAAHPVGEAGAISGEVAHQR